MVKNPSANAGDAGDVGLIPGLGRSPGEGHGNPHQYSCLKNPMDRGASGVTVHGVAKNWTRLMTEFTHTQHTHPISRRQRKRKDIPQGKGNSAKTDFGLKMQLF